MQHTMKPGLIFGVAALLAFVAGIFIPLPIVNYLIAFGSVLALGIGAGYTAAKTHRQSGQAIGYGATTGAIAGIAVLVLGVIAYAILANTAWFQQALVNAAQSGSQIIDANTANPSSVDPVVPAYAFGVGGAFCLGLVLAGLMFAGGAIGGLLGRGVPSVADTGAGAYGSVPTAARGSGTVARDGRDERHA